jgi:hypothetical protein
VQSRNGNIPIASDVSLADDPSDESRMWYVRLKIRDDRLAKLWAWKLAEHDVIVWSEAEDRWKQLLAVPELRVAVRKATASAFARKTAPPPALPAAQVEPPDSHTRPRFLQSTFEAEGEEDELTRRVSRSSYYPDMDMEPTAVNQSSRALPYPSSRPPPPVDLLRALTTTLPPAAHLSLDTEFPRAPRVPSITELAQTTTRTPQRVDTYESRDSSLLPPRTQSAYPPVRSNAPTGQSSYLPPPAIQLVQQPSHLAVRPQYIVARPQSQFTIKNLSWAMLPVACAGVFAIFLDRYLPHPVTVQVAPAAAIAASDMSESGAGQLASTLGAMFGMSVGASQPVQGSAAQAPATQGPSNLTPEQLAPVVASPKVGAARGAVSRAAPRVAAGAAKGDDKEKSAALAASQVAQAAANDSFDRDGARTALKFAASRVRNCSNSGVTGSALITFGPSGTVQKVQLAQLDGDDVDSSCVSRALSATRVPPFTGAPVTVRKSF